MSKYKLWCLAPLFLSFAALATSEESINDAYVFGVLKPQNSLNYVNFKKTILSHAASDVIPASSPEQKVYNSSDIIKDFKRNEITATEKFKNKKIRFKSIALEIGLNAFGDGYIRAGKEYDYVILGVNKDDSEVQKTSSNEPVDMICTFDKYNIHTVYLKGCVPSSEVVSTIASNRLEGFEFNTPNTKTAAVINLIYKTNETSFKNSCINVGDACWKSINNVMSKEGLMKKVDAFAKEKGIYEWLHDLPQVRE